MIKTAALQSGIQIQGNHFPFPLFMLVSIQSHLLIEQQSGIVTRADEVLFLHLGHKEAPQADRRQAEGELPDGASLPQPVGQPGQVAVAVQEVRMQPPTTQGSAQSYQRCYNRRHKAQQTSMRLPASSPQRNRHQWRLLAPAQPGLSCLLCHNTHRNIYIKIQLFFIAV